MARSPNRDILESCRKRSWGRFRMKASRVKSGNHSGEHQSDTDSILGELREIASVVEMVDEHSANRLRQMAALLEFTTDRPKTLPKVSPIPDSGSRLLEEGDLSRSSGQISVSATKHRILLVDDEALILKAYARTLRNFACEVVTANTGTQ